MSTETWHVVIAFDAGVALGALATILVLLNIYKGPKL